MTVSLEEILNQMPEDARAEVFRRADEIRQEINLREMRRLRKLTQRQLIVAGGIRSQQEVDALDALGVDAVAGMAVYTNLLAV